ncbi:MAG TPA: hypothetical protein VGJ73_12615 [Verrucomicrobiae bacterium]
MKKLLVLLALAIGFLSFTPSAQASWWHHHHSGGHHHHWWQWRHHDH